ncbi:hypothetical protein DFH06DRAFT_1176646 [Mycena polygramma]|nr:hypothetical protein DFH06DRAFT_1176646 [Mycena polygramma]
MSLTGAGPEGEVAPLQVYASFPFSSDEEYQNGLASILASGALDNDPPEDIREEILRRTRVFYFNRVTGNTVTMDEAREFEQAHKAQASAGDASPSAAAPLDDAAANAEPAVLSFAQLQALIEAGKADQIPNNKIIPDELNDAAPSESAAVVRKKPWEVESGSGTQAETPVP